MKKTTKKKNQSFLFKEKMIMAVCSLVIVGSIGSIAIYAAGTSKAGNKKMSRIVYKNNSVVDKTGAKNITNKNDVPEGLALKDDGSCYCGQHNNKAIIIGDEIFKSVLFKNGENEDGGLFSHGRILDNLKNNGIEICSCGGTQVPGQSAYFLNGGACFLLDFGCNNITKAGKKVYNPKCLIKICKNKDYRSKCRDGVLDPGEDCERDNFPYNGPQDKYGSFLYGASCATNPDKRFLCPGPGILSGGQPIPGSQGPVCDIDTCKIIYAYPHCGPCKK